AGFRLLNRSVWRNRGVLRISTAGWACLGKWCSFETWWKYPFPYSKLLSQQPEIYINLILFKLVAPI
ncbi:MAG: hypothetical protein E6230_10155, partial [Paenibacillus dendritiformis]|nr:hypothetical protein [Paenibacillus dendritiformis]